MSREEVPDIPELKFADNDWYKFPSVKTEGYVNSIWKNMYKVIANINNFLTWIDKNKEVLTTPDYYEIMKGEALGLRAFVYFDLLRLYRADLRYPGRSFVVVSALSYGI